MATTLERITEAAKQYKRADCLALTAGELEVVTQYVLCDLGIEQFIDADEISIEEATRAVVAGLDAVGQRIEV